VNIIHVYKFTTNIYVIHPASMGLQVSLDINYKQIGKHYGIITVI